MASGLPRVIDRFIPDRLRGGSATERLRLRLAITLPLAHGAFGVFVGLIFVAVGLTTFALPFLLSGPMCFVLPYLFRRTGSVPLVAHLLALITLGSMFVLMVWTRGAYGPMSLALLPSLFNVVVLVGFRRALPWGAACIGWLGGLWIAQSAGVELPLMVPLETIYEVILPAGGLLALLNLLEVAAATDALQRTSLAELERANDRLERARREAEASNHAKSAFLANMSHEIRTPMNAIVGMTEIVLEDTAEPSARERLEVVQGAARGLIGLVEAILDLSKIQSGYLKIAEQPFSLRDLVVGCCRLLAPAANAHGATLTSEIPADLPDGWLGDGVKLRQVLVNLISNAIKFSDGTPVRVAARALPDREGVLFVVSDRGRGIPQDALPAIFEPFARATNAAEVSGTGLGLSIVRGLVDAMGGAIRVDSAAGEGTSFEVSLPLSPSGEELPDELKRRVTFDATGEPRPGGVVRVSPPRVLIVEDNPNNQHFLADLLRRDGATLFFATDADEATRRLEDPCFDLVLMDLKVPGSTGLDLTRRRRAFEAEHSLPRVPILAVTAQAIDGTLEACLEAGLDGLVPKPIEASRLRAAIREHLPG